MDVKVKRTSTVGNIAVTVLVAGLVLALNSWLVMIALGAANSYDGRVPAFSYIVCVLLVFAATAATKNGSE